MTDSLLSETAIQMGLKYLELRVARAAALLLSCGLAVLCVFRPSWPGLLASVGFMLLVNLPLWLRRGGA